MVRSLPCLEVTVKMRQVWLVCGDNICCPARNAVSNDYMQRSLMGPSKKQGARIGSIRGILFDTFSLEKDAENLGPPNASFRHSFQDMPLPFYSAGSYGGSHVLVCKTGLRHPCPHPCLPACRLRASRFRKIVTYVAASNQGHSCGLASFSYSEF